MFAPGMDVERLASLRLREGGVVADASATATPPNAVRAFGVDDGVSPLTSGDVGGGGGGKNKRGERGGASLHRNATTTTTTTTTPASSFWHKRGLHVSPVSVLMIPALNLNAAGGDERDGGVGDGARPPFGGGSASFREQRNTKKSRGGARSSLARGDDVDDDDDANEPHAMDVDRASGASTPMTPMEPNAFAAALPSFGTGGGTGFGMMTSRNASYTPPPAPRPSRVIAANCDDAGPSTSSAGASSFERHASFLCGGEDSNHAPADVSPAFGVGGGRTPPTPTRPKARAKLTRWDSLDETKLLVSTNLARTSSVRLGSEVGGGTGGGGDGGGKNGGIGGVTRLDVRGGDGGGDDFSIFLTTTTTGSGELSSSPHEFLFADHFHFEKRIGRSKTSEAWLVRSKQSDQRYCVKKITAPFNGASERTRYAHEVEARSIHWSPYDRVGVVNAVS